MIFKLNTNNDEDMCLDISDERETGDLQNAIGEFCGGIASFFTEFAIQLNCKRMEQARALEEVCLSCIKDNIDGILDEVFCDEDYEEDNGLTQDELEDLAARLKESGFSEDEISSIVKLVQSVGSIEDANEYLKGIAEQKNIDLDFENET